MPQVTYSILQLKMVVSIHSPVIMNKESDFYSLLFDYFITGNRYQVSVYAHLSLYWVKLVFAHENLTFSVWHNTTLQWL